MPKSWKEKETKRPSEIEKALLNLMFPDQNYGTYLKKGEFRAGKRIANIRQAEHLLKQEIGSGDPRNPAEGCIIFLPHCNPYASTLALQIFGIGDRLIAFEDNKDTIGSCTKDWDKNIKKLEQATGRKNIKSLLVNGDITTLRGKDSHKKGSLTNHLKKKVIVWDYDLFLQRDQFPSCWDNIQKFSLERFSIRRTFSLRRQSYESLEEKAEEFDAGVKKFARKAGQPLVQTHLPVSGKGWKQVLYQQCWQRT